MRVVVFADTDVFADEFIGFRLSANAHPAKRMPTASILFKKTNFLSEA